MTGSRPLPEFVISDNQRLKLMVLSRRNFDGRVMTAWRCQCFSESPASHWKPSIPSKYSSRNAITQRILATNTTQPVPRHSGLANVSFCCERMKPMRAQQASVVRDVADTFLACGILDHEFARSRCDGCTHEYLLALSCNWHPHLHLIVTDGGFRPDGTFVTWPAHDTAHLTEVFRRAALRLFVRLELFDEDQAGGMRRQAAAVELPSPAGRAVAANLRGRPAHVLAVRGQVPLPSIVTTLAGGGEKRLRARGAPAAAVGVVPAVTGTTPTASHSALDHTDDGAHPGVDATLKLVGSRQRD